MQVPAFFIERTNFKERGPNKHPLILCHENFFERVKICSPAAFSYIKNSQSKIQYMPS